MAPRRDRELKEIKMTEINESEFGKGLIICLVKFAEHRARWQNDKDIYMELHKANPELFDESFAVERHFNAASDHLYEIEVPDKWSGTDIAQRVKELQGFGLEIGHNFTPKKWTKNDVEKAYKLCQEIAILIDKKIGLNPEIGQW